MVRAKFQVSSVEAFIGDTRIVKLQPVTSGSEENKSFWKYTPSGELRMQIDNPLAADQFKPGMQFYVDFTPAE